MNKKLQDFARKDLKKGLAKLPEGWQQKFKQMYGKKDETIEQVVDNMNVGKLDWAMQQVDNSIKKLAKT